MACVCARKAMIMNDEMDTDELDELDSDGINIPDEVIDETDPRVLAAAYALIAKNPQMLAANANTSQNIAAPHKMAEAKPALLSAIRRGMGFKASCRLAKISYQTFQNWRKRGEEELKRMELVGDDYPSALELPYVMFYQDLEEAIGQGEFAMADVIQQAAMGGASVVETRTVQVVENGHVVKEVTTTTEKVLHPDWKAAESVLSRRHDGWQRKQSTEITGPGGGPVASISAGIDLSGYTSEELDALINNLQASIGSGATIQSEAEEID